ncbi:MAG: peptide chain release factor N(5)-glutamine methyltransferase [Pseudomonadota bacterium]
MTSPTRNHRPNEPWTVLRILRWTSGYLAEKGVDSPRLDAEILLADLLGLTRVQLYLNYDRPLVPEELAEYRARVKRRARREPAAYIIGKKEFYSLEFEIGTGVLVPRPETELLVDRALEFVRERHAGEGAILAADLGTGSGALAVSLAANNPRIRVRAVDISPEALQTAKKNALRLGMDDRIEFFEGDLLTPLAGLVFHFIIANLPYVPRAAFVDMAPEVREYEPHLALDGGDDGLDLIRRTIVGAPEALTGGGGLFLEIWPDHSPKIRELARANGFSETVIVKDLAGLDRVAILTGLG